MQEYYADRWVSKWVRRPRVDVSIFFLAPLPVGHPAVRRDGCVLNTWTGVYHGPGEKAFYT